MGAGGDGGSGGGVLMLTVVDEGGRSEPQLCAAFPGGVHDAEVVDAGPQHGAVGWTQLGDAAQQNLHPLTHKPAWFKCEWM